MRHDERTREYVARRAAEGKSKREIMRCLKRYIAREIYRLLAPMAAASAPSAPRSPGNIAQLLDCPSLNIGASESKEPTSGLEPLSCSLRVIIHMLQGFAGDCKCRIFRGVSFLYLATCCTVLRSRWYQIGIRRSDSYRLTAVQWHEPATFAATIRRPLFLGVAPRCRIRLSKQISLLMVARRFWV